MGRLGHGVVPGQELVEQGEEACPDDSGEAWLGNGAAAGGPRGMMELGQLSED